MLLSLLLESLLVVFLWSMSDCKSPQVFRTFLSILADINNAVILMVSTGPFISKSSRLFINHLVTASRAPIIIGINVTFMFLSFFRFLCKVELFIFLFNFTLWSARTPKSTILQVLFFVLLIIMRSGRLAESK